MSQFVAEYNGDSRSSPTVLGATCSASLHHPLTYGRT